MRDDCAGLRGAKAVGDRRVSSLTQFSWKDRHHSGQQVMTVLDEIGNERARQIGVGWGPKHDDEHAGGELAKAAATYTLYAGEKRYDAHGNPPHLWPWDVDWWKPKDKRRDLVRAAALIVAEIERLDRAALSAADGSEAVKFKWSDFASDLREYRERHGLGLRECCRSMPIGKSTWSRAENGKPIEASHFIFLCDWMRRNPKSYAVSAPRPMPTSNQTVKP